MPLAADNAAVPAEQHGRRQLKGAYAIELGRIRADAAQPRRQFDDGELEHLAASIRRHGVMQAITVRYIAKDDVYQIINGERRFRATKLAGLSTIPCLIQDPHDNEILVRQIVENWQRQQLHPFEIADSLAQLRDRNGFSQKELSRETGKPESDISKFLKLLDLEPAVQKDARNDASGVLTFRHLYNVARLERAEQSAVVAAVREQRMSAVETEKLVQRTVKQRTAAPRRGAPLTKVEYVTAKAKVTLTFRKKAVEKEDILAALEEARQRAEGTRTEINIVRAA